MSSRPYNFTRMINARIQAAWTDDERTGGMLIPIETESAQTVATLRMLYFEQGWQVWGLRMGGKYFLEFRDGMRDGFVPPITQTLSPSGDPS